MILRDYQIEDVGNIRAAFKAGFRSVLYVLSTGAGKCFGRGTPILLHNGQTKNAEDVQIGDLLMGPDSQPRRVVSTSTGHEQMYRIVPRKGGTPHVVNESHILSLKRTAQCNEPKYPSQDRRGEVVAISVRDYLNKNRWFTHLHKLWRAAIDFPSSAFISFYLPSYLLGVWLGGGDSDGAHVTTADHEIIDYLRGFCCARPTMKLKVEPTSSKAKVCKLLHVNGRHLGRGHRTNPVTNELRRLNLLNNKHVPLNYKTGSRQERLELLAGILDTDRHWTGKGYELTLKSKQLIDDVIFVARSLGFSANPRPVNKKCCNNRKVGQYWICHINGPVDLVPCKIVRKEATPRRQKKNPLLTGFTVDALGNDEYFGFEIEGPDRLFMLGDFTVTHNSAIFNYIGGSVAKNGFKVCVVVHRDELLHQNMRAFEDQSIEYGVIAPRHSRSSANVQIASVWTLSRASRLLQWPNFDMLIVDECHHLAAKSFERLIAAYPKALKLSVSATPSRLDGIGLGQYCDTLIQGPPMRELIARGYLAACDVYGPPTDLDLTQVHTRMGEYITKELEGAVDKAVITGSAVEHYRKFAPGQPAVAFCVSIRHCEHVAERFNREGIAAASIDGRMDTPQRQRLIADLSKGALKILTSCQLLTEGVDVPTCRSVIMLRPTQSLTLFLQMTGRGMRPKADGAPMILQDHVGNCLRHGLPDNEREWTLEGRKRGVNDEVAAPPIRICKNCRAIFSAAARHCPKCGTEVPRHDRMIDEVDGELVRLTPEEALRQKWKAERVDPNTRLFKDMNEEEERIWEKQQYAQLCQKAEEKGYDKRWINIVLAKRRAVRNQAKRTRKVA